jgi:protein-S-isoprenylcysteine O-methyltransferase Ste14
MEKALRYFLPLYVLAYFATALVWRSYLVRRRTGINPYIAGDKNTPHGYAAFLLRLIFLGCLTIVILFVRWPETFSYLIPIPWLHWPIVVYLGLILLIASLVWILIAQAQMGESWRIGFDANSKTALVKKGLYSWSRNPIFLGMRITLIGLFLVLPSAATLVIMILGNAVIQIQVRLEEAHLLKTHGESYQAYCQQTNRWL